MVRLGRSVRGSRWLICLLVSLSLCLAGMDADAAAKPRLNLSKASWSAKKHTLIVKGKLTKGAAATPIEIFDLNGRRLGEASASPFTLKVDTQQQPSIPCAVRVQSGSLETIKKVVGAPKSCLKGPLCQILSPASGTQVKANEKVSFAASASVKDKQAGALKTEWDFAGGVLQTDAQRMNKLGADGLKTEAVFVRDNSRYRVRFSATDAKNRRCEDSIEITVGNPPAGLPDVSGMAKAAQQSQPKLASGLQGNRVVMPFEKRSMQCGHDSELLTSAPRMYPDPANSINAYVYEKALRPIPLGPDKIDLTYTAASNPADPVGSNSINSTSQNWPLDKPMLQAALQKGQFFERYIRPPGSTLAEGYYSYSLIDTMSGYYPGVENAHLPLADEGAYATLYAPITYEPTPINADHGRYMPGIANPYMANDAQTFSDFVMADNWFSAYWLPVTDIDDSGRVNPTSLFRIQATDHDSQTPVAATDMAVTAGKDFHCRECHVLGKLGANPSISRVNAAGDTSVMWMPTDAKNVPEQEASALQNAGMLHAFYDQGGNSGGMIEMVAMGGHMPGQPIQGDGPGGCGNNPGMCHSSVSFTQVDQGYIGRERPRTDRGSMSNAVHRMHGKLQYNADKTDVLRDDKGRYLRWDPTQGGTNAASLFPVKDADGKLMPMEENCLKCHSGQREQCYRDRMFTAGVTCYQCHGDMLAVADIYEKPHVNPDGNNYRLEWLDQPDCGACHTGSGNLGKGGGNGYFSAGVKTLAFDENDPSATPNKVDLTNPDQRRFAVLPLTDLPQTTGGYNPILRTPLFRFGKDIHGQVACAACHGAAHSIWPNRDPNANDNVTSLELQGHTGSVLECNVCHTADSFAKFEDLDEGLKVTDAKTGVLGGPHNLHPINDPNWWKTAAADTPNADGSTSGGWHNNYAKLPGKAGDDQCAACHGNDHLGTRLSKAPADRTFDFSNLPDRAKLKKAGVKPKVTVKAGTPIGCNTCHSASLSCTGSPNPDCGKASEQVTGPTDQAPLLAQPYFINGTIGLDISHTLVATDAEGDTPIFALAGANTDFVIDDSGAFTVPASQMESWIHQQQEQADQTGAPNVHSPFNQEIKLIVSDIRGAYSIQPITFHFDCPAGLIWDPMNTGCTPLAFVSRPPSGAFDAGTIQQYQVLAISGTGSPLTYALADPVPPGMIINDQGVITWDTRQIITSGDIFGQITVSDTAGNQAYLPYNFTVCRSPMHFNSETYSCVGAVHITSTPPLGASFQPPFQYHYQVIATQDNGKHVDYSLVSQPDGLTIDAQGGITLDTTNYQGQQISFQVEANDGLGSWARQVAYVQICYENSPIWNSAQNSCEPGPIAFTSTPDSYTSAHQPYSYRVTTSNSHNAPVSLALDGQPTGMSVDGTGLVSWDMNGVDGQQFAYRIIATDKQGGWTQQTVSVNLCPGETPIYDPAQGSCVSGPIQFTSVPDSGVSFNGVYHYRPVTTDTNAGPVAYSLNGEPNGANIDNTGQVNWDSTGYGGQSIVFGVAASDPQHAWTQQTVYLTVCPELTPTWDPVQYSCVP